MIPLCLRFDTPWWSLLLPVPAPAPVPYHFQQFDREHELGSLGMALDTLQGVTVSTLTEAVHADLSDDEAGSADDSDR